MSDKDYEIRIGLEVHSELKTDTKLFCSCKNKFERRPNIHCCPICTGMPGVMPSLNKKTVELALITGIAMNCTINKETKFDRKNYFYPDLPKAYQISQYDKPICYEGYIPFEYNGKEKVIRINRIHIEEDAGKLIHHGRETLIDFNRSCVPLIEIVTEPDFDEAGQIPVFMETLRKILLFLDVSDCKMNEGSLRCDINLSVKKKSDTKLGTRTEMKNINSFTNAYKAAKYEAKRQIEVLENGGVINRQTRRYDAEKEITVSLRSKETLADYRFFSEPDLPSVTISDEQINTLKSLIPRLPNDRINDYKNSFGLSNKDARLMCSSKLIADLFESSITVPKEGRTVCNMIKGMLFKHLDEYGKEQGPLGISANQIRELVRLMNDGEISMGIAKDVFEEIYATALSPAKVVDEKGLRLNANKEELEDIIKQVFEENQKAVFDYKNGKDKAKKALVGSVMKKTKGRANPIMVNEIMLELLNTIK